MVVDQLPPDVGLFARYLRRVTARLDRGGGWYGVFWQRDPEGLFACLEGSEIPPWDVVESLLHDLAADGAETARARALHTAAAAAHDRRPTGREDLGRRLELMRREKAQAAERGEELLRRLTALPEGSPEYRRLAHDLSWTNDDHTRATARCTELSARLAALPPDEPDLPDEPDRPYPPDPADPLDRLHRPEPEAPPVPRVPEARRGRGGGRRRPRGARYAWLEEDEQASESAGPAAEGIGGIGGVGGVGGEAVGLGAMPVTASRPRGARYGGAAVEADEGVPFEERPAAGPRGAGPAVTGPPVTSADEDTWGAAAETVALLGRLRAEGRSGEAHAVLCEAAAQPAGRLPMLAAELHRAGLGADWATLLWEAASLPPEQLVAAAVALADAGRADDCGQLLRQGVARPAGEVAAAVLLLADAGRGEAAMLLEAFLRVRTPEEAARIAATDPRRLVPQLLAAARAVSPDRERDLVHALRVAGLITG
ncbi:hypothetical protein [Streptomyces sp. NPDC000410]|uniref:hypothetical protein n=1 Tax=Streptomyces sp. NPDC000410 TaxID=3154254 RepID=UPI003330EED7